MRGWADPRPKPPPGVPVQWEHPMARELKACWLFNEGAGSAIIDASGQIPPCQETGAASTLLTRTSGRSGPVLAINGTDSSGAGYFNFGRTILNPGLKGMTITAWIKSSDTDFSVFGKPVAGPGAGRWSFLESISAFGDANICIVQMGANTYATPNYTKANIASGNWEHACWVVDRPTNSILYHNARNVASVSVAADVNTSISSTAIDVILGAYNDSTGIARRVDSRFNGTIDSLMVWHRAFTPAEVLEHYQSTYAMFLPPRLTRTVAGSSFQSAWARGANRLIGGGVWTGG